VWEQVLSGCSHVINDFNAELLNAIELRESSPINTSSSGTSRCSNCNLSVTALLPPSIHPSHLAPLVKARVKTLALYVFGFGTSMYKLRRRCIAL